MRKYSIALACLVIVPACLARLPHSGDFRGCSPKGWGGDHALNRQKNRALPVVHPVAMTIAQINALPLQDVPRWRRQWNSDQRAEVALYESQGVTVEGYIIGFNSESMEAGNCYRPDLHDLHMWVASGPNEPRSRALVAEVTPRWQARNHTWKKKYVKMLMRDRIRVRLTGWLMLDQAHPDQMGRSRAGDWEIHPVTRIEVLSSDQPDLNPPTRIANGARSGRLLPTSATVK